MVLEVAVSELAAELLKAMTSEAGKDAYKKGKEILGSLRSRFAGNPKAAEVISRYEQYPMQHDADLRGFLMEAARSDPEFGEVLQISANRLASAHTTIGTQIVHNETVHGPKTVTTISAGRDVIERGGISRKPPNPSE